MTARSTRQAVQLNKRDSTVTEQFYRFVHDALRRVLMGTYRLWPLCRDAVYETFQIRKRQVRAGQSSAWKQLGDQEAGCGEVKSAAASSAVAAQHVNYTRC
jgi:hypothetical protein